MLSMLSIKSLFHNIPLKSVLNKEKWPNSNRVKTVELWRKASFPFLFWLIYYTAKQKYQEV